MSSDEILEKVIDNNSLDPHSVSNAGQSFHKVNGKDIICFSHLRWDFVFQRPQHLLSRAAKQNRVIFWEEPITSDAKLPCLTVSETSEGVIVVQPHLPYGNSESDNLIQRDLLNNFMRKANIKSPILWYYTPAALSFTRHLSGNPTVYDCMDELSAFQSADPRLPDQELELLSRASLVFTGGESLYEAKSALHRNVHKFSSGVDVAHFRPARDGLSDPKDQAHISYPRLGFYGVLDERLDLELLKAVAVERPDWQIVLVGPVVKIAHETLPILPNIHYLGGKTYHELPHYLANWDVALLPFAINEATRFISPTKTPEYLAGGRPVVSTPIVDVVRSYGGLSGVEIVGDTTAFIAAVDRSIKLANGDQKWLAAMDLRLGYMSWDLIWQDMANLISSKLDVTTNAKRSTYSKRYDVVVVGSGFAGSVLAERLATGSNKKVLVIDRRPHIGGNAYDAVNEAGILIHPYGPHIFHTNSPLVFDYLSRFTDWRPYEHKVLASVHNQLLPIPINRTTVNRFFGVDMTEDEVEKFLAEKAVPIANIRTSADVVLSRVGKELYEALFRGYSRKQWGLDPSELDKSVTARVPTRTNDDDRYFNDTFQAMPNRGYTKMFENLLAHSNIDLMLSTEYGDVIDQLSYQHMIYTGPIDAFFNYRFGKLPYRSLNFKHETLEKDRHQPAAVINFPSEELPYTRVTEFKQLTGQSHKKTSLCYEYPSAVGDPYYPIPRPENAALYERYRALADITPNVSFVGRLATYRYYNMDQVVAQALATYERLLRQGIGLPELQKVATAE